MTIQGRLKQMLKTVAVALGDELRARLVFVGGCTTALYITDPVALEGVRATDDVDLIVDLAGYSDWVKLLDQVRKQGFSEAPNDNVVCRMMLGELKVDFMPDDEKILGFSNRWYAKGIESAVETPLDEAITIRRLTPPLFIATKLEAYRGRGNGDLVGSRDAEDILLLVDGREELPDEISAGDADVRLYIAEQFKRLLADPAFDHFLEGNIRGPRGRSEIVRDRFVVLSQYIR